MTKKGYKNSENKNATKKDCEAVILFPSQSLKNVKRIKKDMAKKVNISSRSWRNSDRDRKNMGGQHCTVIVLLSETELTSCQKWSPKMRA